MSERFRFLLCRIFGHKWVTDRGRRVCTRCYKRQWLMYCRFGALRVEWIDRPTFTAERPATEGRPPAHRGAVLFSFHSHHVSIEEDKVVLKRRDDG